MPSLKDLKNRIDSIKSTQKITKAMQMVAAAKLKKARLKFDNALDYVINMEYLLANSLASLPGHIKHPLINGHADAKPVVLLVVVAADRGLCGAFNAGVIRKARKIMEQYEHSQQEFKLLCIGKKAHEVLKSKHADRLASDYFAADSKNLSVTSSAVIMQQIVELFQQDKFTKVEIIANYFQSVISNEIVRQQLLPYEYQPNKNFMNILNNSANDIKPFYYNIADESNEFLGKLAMDGLVAKLHHVLLASNVGEQAARMSSMDNATRNSGDIIQGLTLVYNRTRQAKITKELIEIISGAEAL
jgi:F-type H+-transporting ATPase subunit gamma